MEEGTVTIEFVNKPVPESDAASLWIYLIDGDGDGQRRRLIRKVTRVFAEGGEEESWVGVYAAKPAASTSDAGEGLEVSFSGLTVE